ncbi:hypothetical protein [Pseudonocardia xinjiangensis]|nr:hypothetical protein [Pseudonocardia xinjiangensis]
MAGLPALVLDRRNASAQQPYLPSFVNHGPISLPAWLVFLGATVGSPRVS